MNDFVEQTAIHKQNNPLDEALNLIKEKCENLPYHNERHIRMVSRRALVLAQHAGLTEEEIDLLFIAASFHDVIQEYELSEESEMPSFKKRKRRIGYNEEQSAKVAEDYMRDKGSYTDEQIERVRNAILGTIPIFTKDKGIIQRAFYDEKENQIQGEIDPIARILALADLDVSGIENPIISFIDAINVFLEDWVKKDSSSNNFISIGIKDILNNNQLLEKFKKFIDFQKSFIESRKQNLNNEVDTLLDDRQKKDLFPNFDKVKNLTSNIYYRWDDFINKLRRLGHEPRLEDWNNILQLYLI